eukprot:3675978-Alexandrium_andersonii.AAC.1
MPAASSTPLSAPTRSVGATISLSRLAVLNCSSVAALFNSRAYGLLAAGAAAKSRGRGGAGAAL